MNFKISQMAAQALLEHTALDASLEEKINSAPSKADILYLSAPKELLQKA